MPHPSMFDETDDLALRRDWPDWWLGASAMPPGARADWLHLLRVAREVERIPERAREPMIAQIRLSWWGEMIAEIYAGEVPRPHPLAKDLAEIIRRRALPRNLWDGWLAAMAERFDPPENGDVPSTEEWLFALATHLLGAPMDTPQAAEPWQELGRLWTLLHALRLQAFSVKPELGVVQAAAQSALVRAVEEPPEGGKFWRVQRRIVQFYLRRAQRANDAASLQSALKFSRVMLPLQLIF